MTEEELQAIEERWAKATPGPWMWDVNTSCKQVHLETTHSGRIYVLWFRRYGMQGAQPMFQHDGFIYGVEKFAVPRAKHHPDFDMDIDHPDAQAIVSAPTDISALLAEVRRLNRMVDVLVDAHVGCNIPESQRIPERCKQACTDKCLREWVESEVADNGKLD